MEILHESWFSEVSNDIPGQAMSLKVEKILAQKKSKFQDILIFKSSNHGRVLVLDEFIQLTEKDEFMYQEMISMLPLNSHPNPESVLIIGGGDGGVVREVAKHNKVKKIILCEIDEDVVNLSKDHLPFTAVGFDSDKLNLIIDDGFKYLENHKNEFDVIITDSTDPKGPGEVLFNENYFKLIDESLKKDGIMCSQGQNIWLELHIIKRLVTTCKSIFPVVRYANTTVPTYSNGQIGFILCSKNAKTQFERPIDDNLLFQDELKYYDPLVHTSSFVMPYSVKKVLEQLYL